MNNTVELIGYYGNDETHALSAWTSTSRDLTEDKKNRIGKLLKMLASEGHHTPFEKSTLHFLVNVDQATHIHILKHRIGVSINGESARYKELKEDKFLTPEDFTHFEIEDVNMINKYNCYTYEQLLFQKTNELNEIYHACLKDGRKYLGDKRAKESARFFKMFNSQITMDISFNWRSFYHFQKLRNDVNAQKEVRELAQEMLKQVKELGVFKETIKAFEL
nr:FAD-dependent thymidylate synthase [uncultured Flavobacterium sp.]